MDFHLFRRYLSFLKRSLSHKHIRRNISICVITYTILSIIYVYRVAILGEDNVVDNFIRPFFLMFPISDESVAPKVTYPNNLKEANQLYEKLRYDTSARWVDEYYLKENLLTVPMGTKKGQMLDSVDELEFYDSDPRLVWSVYLNDIMKHDKSSDYQMPFSWYDFADFRNYNKLISIKDKYSSTFQCDILFNTAFDRANLEKWEKDIGEQLFQSEREKYKDAFWYRSGRSFTNDALKNLDKYCESVTLEDSRFKLDLNVSKLDERVRPEVFELQARNYLINHVKHPLSITILEGDKFAYRFNVEQEDRSNMVQSKILQNFINSRIHDDKDKNIIFDHDVIYEKFLSEKRSKDFRVDIPDTDRSIYERNLVHLTIDDFKFDSKRKIQELDSLPESELSVHDKNYLESLKNSIRTHASLATKYFNECGGVIQFKSMGHHRDERFFNGALIYDELQYSARLNSLIRTFQKFVKANGLISWLSHGTLYGHLYNGLTFPWDNDFDLQMPLKHLHYMAQYFNQSLIMEDIRGGNGKFLLDIGSSITSRNHGNGYNNIDARFIDIDSGLYIDITALAISSDPISRGKFEFYDKQWAEDIKNSEEVQHPTEETINSYRDSFEGLAKLTTVELMEYLNQHTDEFSSESVEAIIKSFKSEDIALVGSATQSKNLNQIQRYIFNEKLQMVACRNKHFNTVDTISPLSLSTYHGVSAFVPHKPITSLKVEYSVPGAYGFASYGGYAFISRLNYWLKGAILKVAANMDKNPALLEINSSFNNLQYNDILGIFKNLLISQNIDAFSTIYNSFSAVTYRQKELEIKYDNEIDLNDKQKYLDELRITFGSTISSPSKDPLLLDYERKLWADYLKTSNGDEVQEMMAYVNEKSLKKLWKNYTKIHQGVLFKSNGTDLGSTGLHLFEDPYKGGNSLFTVDPKLQD